MFNVACGSSSVKVSENSINCTQFICAIVNVVGEVGKYYTSLIHFQTVSKPEKNGMGLRAMLLQQLSLREGFLRVWIPMLWVYQRERNNLERFSMWNSVWFQDMTVKRGARKDRNSQKTSHEPFSCVTIIMASTARMYNHTQLKYVGVVSIDFLQLTTTCLYEVEWAGSYKRLWYQYS